MTAGILNFSAPVFVPAGKKSQVNLAILDPQTYGQDFPFINVARQNTGWTYFGTTTQDIYSLLNSNGYPTAMPTGTPDNWSCAYNAYVAPNCTFTGSVSGTTLTVSGSVTGDPLYIGETITGTGITAETTIISGSGTSWQVSQSMSATGSITISAFDVWVQTYGGTGDVQSQGGGTTGSLVTAVSTVANRIEYTITGLPTHSTVSIQTKIRSISVTPSNICFYRKSWEALFLGGQQTSPDFIAFYSPYKRLRFMDWGQINGSLLAQWANRPLKTDFSWVGYKIDPNLYCGLATVSKNAYTGATAPAGNPSSWVNGMVIEVKLPSAPTFFTVTAFTNGVNPTVTTSAAHGFSTGDLIFFPNTDINPGFNPSNFQGNLNGAFAAPAYTVGSTTSTTFVLTGVDSTSWGAYVSGGLVANSIRFNAGSLPLKRALTQYLGNFYDGDLIISLSAGQPVYLSYDADCDVLVFGSVYAGQGQKFGIPVEVACQLCNECGCDMWFPLPHMACSDAGGSYGTQMSTLIKSTLNTNLVWDTEFSNEVWNTGAGFWQTPWATIKGNLLFGINDNTELLQWYGYSFFNHMKDITTVYSGSMSRLHRSFGVKTAFNSTTFTNIRFQAPNTGVAAYPITLADGVCIAPYMYPDPAVYPTAVSIYNYKIGNTAAAFSDLTTGFTASSTGAAFTLGTSGYLHAVLYPFWQGICSTYGVQLTQYEGGWGIYPNLWNTPSSYDPGTGPVSLTATDQLNLLTAFGASSNWGTLLTNALADFKSFGGVYPSQFTLTGGQWNSGSMFGMVGPNMYGVPLPSYVSTNPIPAYTAFLTFNNT